MTYWSFAKLHTGLSDAEFWAMEPSQLKALVEQYNKEDEAKGKIIQAQEQNADRRAAVICCVMANSFRTRKKPYKVEDFMPKKEKTKEKQTPEQMVQMVQLWNAALTKGEVQL